MNRIVLKAFVSSRRVLVITLAACLVAIACFYIWKWQSPEQSSSQATPTESTVSDAATDSNPLSTDVTSFTVPVDGGQDNSGTQQSRNDHRKSTATVTATSIKSVTPSKVPDAEPDSPSVPINTAPVLTTVLPASGTYQADASDGSKNYRALVFSATATDNEDGVIADPTSFHWSNLTANCSTAGVDHCMDEKSDNNFTMNMPISDVCPGTRSIDLTEDYRFKVTVQDSKGLTDSREVHLEITYHCVADPASVPDVTIVSPAAIVYPGSSFDASLQPYSAILFNATATDSEDGAITNPNAFTWRLVSGECHEITATPHISCQAEKIGNNFTMNMLGACILGTSYNMPYVYELSVQDSDGNIGTKQIAFAVTADCSDQGN